MNVTTFSDWPCANVGASTRACRTGKSMKMTIFSWCGCANVVSQYKNLQKRAHSHTHQFHAVELLQAFEQRLLYVGVYHNAMARRHVCQICASPIQILQLIHAHLRTDAQTRRGHTKRDSKGDRGRTKEREGSVTTIAPDRDRDRVGWWANSTPLLRSPDRPGCLCWAQCR